MALQYGYVLKRADSDDSEMYNLELMSSFEEAKKEADNLNQRLQRTENHHLKAVVVKIVEVGY